ncbi:hypothetical protein JTB14_001228, partial [Gonioctena quinquepunctata]
VLSSDVQCPFICRPSPAVAILCTTPAGCCALLTRWSMELPRIASQTSICPPSIPGIQLLTEYQKPRESASKKLLQGSKQPAEPQFAVLPSAPAYQPSRKREEARALQNLRRRLQSVRVLQANRPEPIEASCANNNISPEELYNRPYLLQKLNSQTVHVNNKAFWRFANSKRKTGGIPPELGYNGKISSTGEGIPNLFADYFSTVYSNNDARYLTTLFLRLC